MSEKFYEKLIRELPIGYAYHRIICDSEGNPIDYEFLDVNSTFELFTGFKKENILGRKVTEIIPNIVDDEFNWISFYGDIALKNCSKNIEQFSEPLKKWFKVHAYSPEQGFFLTYFTDITDEKVDIEEKLHMIVASNDIVFELDENYVFKDMMVSDESFLFLPKDKVLGKTVKDLFPENLSSLFISSYEKSRKSLKKDSLIYSSPFPTDDRWFKSEVSFIENNGCSKYIVSIHEVTTEKKLEQKVELERQKLNSIIEGTQTGTWEWNIQSNQTTVNERWANLLGYSLEEILPITTETWETIMHPDDLNKSKQLLESHFRGESEYYSLEFRMKHKNGNWMWILDRGKVVSYTSDGKPLLMLGTHSDITDYKNLELELRNERNLLKTTLLSLEEGVVSIDLDGKILIINHIAEKLTGWKRPESLGRYYRYIFNMESEEEQDFIQDVIDHKRPVELPKHTSLYSKDGTCYPIEGNIAPILNKDGVVNGAVIAFRDITEKLSEQEKVLYLSYHDQLTGLYNRRFFEEELNRIDTPRNLPLSLIMVDVNGLKLTNDAFGHTAGDNLLVAVSQILRSVCRADDIIARIGGDEFAVILPKTDSTVVERVLKRIYNKASKEKLDPIIVSASLGYATKSDAKESITSTFKRAEDKMYKRKLGESKAMREQTLEKIIDIFFKVYKNGKSHSKNVGDLSAVIGESLGLDRNSIEELKMLGMLHDIGLIAVDKDVVNKSSGLSSREWTQVKRHPEVGYQILKSVNHLVPLAEYVLSHHERWDGSGYPDNLKEGEIPLYSRILSIADAYDAMTSERSYKESLSKIEAISELRKNAGSQFDPKLVDIFIQKVLKGGD